MRRPAVFLGLGALAALAQAPALVVLALWLAGYLWAVLADDQDDVDQDDAGLGSEHDYLGRPPAIYPEREVAR